MFLERGFMFTHEAVRDWEARFAPLLAEQLCTKRHGRAGTSWYVDETYRHASMENGATFIGLVILMAIWSIHGEVEKRDMDAAKQFFREAVEVCDHVRGSGNNRRALFLSTGYP
jgi:putative transposase